MRITADRERCASAGMCALTAPGVFDQDDEDGRVVVLNGEPVGGDAADAVDLCPSGALSAADG
ncbi:(4Fe-4S)-binding protein [Glycomyces sp. A-F 0318]|uniref:ferredoxin n=1 Tax=Glycomyces amatae TaxID=2881355 RepID=UPI001E3218AF|nr:(4Fe-4S)-binding protein [Glycomyces amatae]MCD0446042.1 (4Fe-4S)-binding protein [Glycomyces amatae]